MPPLKKGRWHTVGVTEGSFFYLIVSPSDRCDYEPKKNRQIPPVFYIFTKE